MRPRFNRRVGKQRVHRVKLVCILFIVFIFYGCSDNWFRLKPKKGRPHPHPPEEERFNRTWLYKHTIEPVDMFSEEERMYRAERARQLALEKKFYAASVSGFELALRKISILNFKLADSIFGEMLFRWFTRALDIEGYSVSLSQMDNLSNSASDKDNFISMCSQATGVKIVSHLHYGDDPEDTETYYEAFNGLFPISGGNNICRIFRVDIVRLGRKANGDDADRDVVFSLFSSENVLTDKAWNVDEDYPDSASDVVPDISELGNSVTNHPDSVKALFNFMQSNIHNPLGIRFQEILVSKDPANPEVKYSPIHIMTLAKDEVADRLEQRGSEH